MRRGAKHGGGSRRDTREATAALARQAGRVRARQVNAALCWLTPPLRRGIKLHINVYIDIYEELETRVALD